MDVQTDAAGSTRRQSPFPRKPLAIKKNDGEILTRSDIQYDFLSKVFADTAPAFTDPRLTLDGAPPGTKVSFRDLYVNALLHSPKITKGLRDALVQSPVFATDFAMLALLTNVGRVHSTMSFFAEKKTTVRTYHPIPAFERVDGNLQDAPRIKALLKSSLLPEEDPRSLPSSPAEIKALAMSGKSPPTNIANIIFTLASHSPALGEEFLGEYEFIDLFLPLDISSSSRARIFLWLCYHYYEFSSPNPEGAVDSPSKRANPFSDPLRPGTVPAFAILTRAEAEMENVDTPEEIARGQASIDKRSEVVSKINRFLTVQPEDGNMPPKKARTPARPNLTPQEKKERKALWDKQYRERVKEKAMQEKMRAGQASGQDQAQVTVEPIKPAKPKRKAPTKKKDAATASASPAVASSSRTLPISMNFAPEYTSSQFAVLDFQASSPPNTVPGVDDNPYPDVEADPTVSSRAQRRYTPYRKPALELARPRRRHSGHVPRPTSPPRTMIEHAWHIVNNVDPLSESDEESDVHVRNDYAHRLGVISRLRGRDPTPEPPASHPVHFR
ncbi:hypothetical protein CYLTODRAFT_417544 [Cylindrobasidium torrendii FP15055 ss-10]|uniref:Ino eighty subunit 1 n=1 Tax=Cylindrobasidium torrendii FP15055 ss-10 TaxID=1314674 RepID=A0A0D7BRB7_9AGAR|nr:hypothetical protein CYLTODRAFT_417544 [Cylindrobasidium torrendii FP15055 ss-10]